VAAGIISIIFGQVANLPSDGIPYFVFSFAGLLGWNLVNGVINRSSGSLVANQSLVSKVFFPRLLVPLGTILATLLDFAIALVLFVILLFIFGINPGLPALFLPLWVLCSLLLALGVGVAASAIMVKYRDVAYVLPWFLQLFFYATPIAYSLSAVPANLLWLFQINPLSWLMEAYRWSLLGLAAPPLWELFALGGVAVVVFLGGVLIFQRHERGFADVI